MLQVYVFKVYLQLTKKNLKCKSAFVSVYINNVGTLDILSIVPYMGHILTQLAIKNTSSIISLFVTL